MHLKHACPKKGIFYYTKEYENTQILDTVSGKKKQKNLYILRRKREISGALMPSTPVWYVFLTG